MRKLMNTDIDAMFAIHGSEKGFIEACDSNIAMRFWIESYGFIATRAQADQLIQLAANSKAPQQPEETA